MTRKIATPPRIKRKAQFESTEDLQGQIGRRAYEVREERSRADGQDLNDWLKRGFEVRVAATVSVNSIRSPG